MNKAYLLFIVLFACLPIVGQAQNQLQGTLRSADGQALVGAAVVAGSASAVSNNKGTFSITIPKGTDTIRLKIRALGYARMDTLASAPFATSYNITLQELTGASREVVLTGSLQEVSQANSTTPVEVYSKNLLRKFAPANIFESFNQVPGVTNPMVCQVCHTGELRINGLEGPYTLVMIDGVPIISSLASIYALNGIPPEMVERIEIVRGPASALYGSEAMGGAINVITKGTATAPRASATIWGSTYGELNLDAGVGINNKLLSGMVGLNLYNFQQEYDKVEDGFMDIPLQQRLSAFTSLNFKRKDNRIASVFARYYYEDRMGGVLGFKSSQRGSDQIYGESIFTNRFELAGRYELPVPGKTMLWYGYNYHNQDSYYGDMKFLATQQTAFAQLVNTLNYGKGHQLDYGAALRFMDYRDNTALSFQGADSTQQTPQFTYLPGIFAQNEWTLPRNQKFLVGGRLDYHSEHGPIFTPRANYLLPLDDANTFRVGAGTGFRVVNLVTEDHAAISGSRQVIIEENLNPERSWNININHTGTYGLGNGWLLTTQSGLFYTQFSNKILPDYDSDPNQIRYGNLAGIAVSRGANISTNLSYNDMLNWNVGLALNDVFQTEENDQGELERSQVIYAPPVTINSMLDYTLRSIKTTFTYGLEVYSPMRMPVFPNDFRPEYSPWYSLHNVQVSYKHSDRLELFAGVRNLFNFLPRSPLLRPFDPFDQTADDPISNPQGYTFDTAYSYAPLWGRRGFAGVRWRL